MIFRVQILLLAILLLSGCGHLRSDKPATTEPLVIAKQGGDSTQDSAANKKNQTSSLSLGTNSDAEKGKAKAEDLISRLRAGFELPDYESKYVRQYEKWNSQHPTYLRDLFIRAEPFLYYIVEELDKRKMPLDLALLPAVESAFKPAAKSSSAAAGLWQFIPATGRHFGLRQDWWYDGRLDALAATHAALDYLAELHAMFDGDWFLALAAYNAGQGTVRKAIERNNRKGKQAQYADLILRSETVRYVPKLFALRNIIAQPEKFGVSLPTIPNKPHFSVLPLSGQLDLQRFSRESGIDINSLRHLNAAHKRWATSPQGPHRLLIPLPSLAAAQSSLERLRREPAIEFQNHQIRRGESLSGIAKRYGVSVSAIQQANNMRGTSIRSGKTLMIPVARIIGSSAKSTVAKTASTTTKPSANQQLVHRVVAGDTLWSIAKRYRVRVTELLSWNRLAANHILSLDQSLLIFLK